MKISSFPHTLAIIGLLTASAMLLSSCNEKVQSVPVIQSMTISPDSVNAGGIALIIVNASDADGDALVYSYAASGGKISGYGDSVYWLAPLTPGYYTTTVRITDVAGNQAIDSVKLYVRDSGKSQITGTASFPEGINFNLSSSKVRLFTSLADRIKGQSFDSVYVFGVGSIVSFTFPPELPGTYYLDVWKDMDNSITLSSGDYLGWYGSGNFSQPELKPLVVLPGITSQIQVQVNVTP